LIVINDKDIVKKAEILREKGTNRSAFFRGEVDKYGWVDVGSSFLPSELVAAYLYAQLEELNTIQNKRMSIWNQYNDLLTPIAEKYEFGLPVIPNYAIHNAHMYYIVTKNLEERDELISFLKSMNVNAVFHYQSLHASTYFSDKHDGRKLPMADKYSNCLLRLPFFYHLTYSQVVKVVETIESFYKKRNLSL
jgi:dTDP-4-amino-4,6-dideoxygalactose transaminase